MIEGLYQRMKEILKEIIEYDSGLFGPIDTSTAQEQQEIYRQLKQDF